MVRGEERQGGVKDGSKSTGGAAQSAWLITDREKTRSNEKRRGEREGASSEGKVVTFPGGGVERKRACRMKKNQDREIQRGPGRPGINNGMERGEERDWEKRQGRRREVWKKTSFLGGRNQEDEAWGARVKKGQVFIIPRMTT